MTTPEQSRADTIRAAFERVFAPDAVCDVQPLCDSPDNRSWLVACAGERLVAKLPEAAGGITVGPALEYEILGIAANVGVAPTPRGFDAHSNILFVDQIAECREFSSADATSEESITRIAETLRRLHGAVAPQTLRSFDLPAFVADYLDDCDSAAAASLGTELLVLHDRHARLLAGDALCHNDLHGANILQSEQLWLVDFEYAVRANPVVDFASYAAFNSIGCDAAYGFARQCAGDALAFSAQQLAEVMHMQALLAELWETARSSNNERSQRQSK